MIIKEKVKISPLGRVMREGIEIVPPGAGGWSVCRCSRCQVLVLTSAHWQLLLAGVPCVPGGSGGPLLAGGLRRRLARRRTGAYRHAGALPAAPRGQTAPHTRLEDAPADAVRTAGHHAPAAQGPARVVPLREVPVSPFFTPCSRSLLMSE